MIDEHKWYQIAACPACGVVRIRIVTAEVQKRQNDAELSPRIIGGAQVWCHDFCDLCQREYDAAQARREDA